ncbi:MAG: alpha/beta hydrolase [Gammaproteobacteria bacterium]|nr:alpha/beta hydrolase [Gammaproteobacteria bacterium]
MPAAVDLEAEYNARAAVPEHVAIMSGWETRSAALRARPGCRLDLAYGDGPRRRLDLFTADRAPAPLHVYIHGGYWQRGDKQIYGFVAEELRRRGVHVAVLNYDLCPAVDLDGVVACVREALAWIWRHAAALGVDPGRIQVGGNSAGGHLTAMAMATRWPELGADLPARLVHSALAISGLYELAPLIGTSVNAAVGMDERGARRNSPVLLSPAAASPLVVAVGGLESAEFHRQARSFAAAWRAAGVPVTLLEIPGTNHFTIVEQLAAADGVLLDHALALLGT